jgi:hypothetical protein
MKDKKKCCRYPFRKEYCPGPFFGQGAFNEYRVPSSQICGCNKCEKRENFHCGANFFGQGPDNQYKVPPSRICGACKPKCKERKCTKSCKRC